MINDTNWFNKTYNFIHPTVNDMLVDLETGVCKTLREAIEKHAFPKFKDMSREQLEMLAGTGLVFIFNDCSENIQSINSLVERLEKDATKRDGTSLAE